MATKSKYHVAYQFPVDPKDIKIKYNQSGNSQKKGQKRIKNSHDVRWFTYKHPTCKHTTMAELDECHLCYKQLITSRTIN